MLQSNELRINNILNTDLPLSENKIVKIAVINSDNTIRVLTEENEVKGCYRTVLFNPEKITKEWLINFGFTESISSYFLPLSDEVDLIIDLHGNLTIGNINFYSQFYYVHQLQNLYFALTQTELTLS